jgi:membrane fusion protein, multidrug efflux system
MKKRAFKITQLFLFIFMPLSIITLFSACGKAKAGATTQKTEDTEVVSVRTAEVEQKTMTHDIVGSGMLSSKAESRPSFKIGGIITKIFVKDGDNIKAGQLLATLDLTEINAQVAQAQMSVDKSGRDLQRVKNLYADTVATFEQLQNATTGADVAKKTLDIAKFNRRFAEIRATKSGKVLKKIMNEGEMAGPGSPIFIINEAASSDWVVRVGVSDRDWAALRVGNSANLSFDAYPNQQFTGRISKLADYADPMSGTFEVEITVSPKSNTRFVSGMYAHAKMTPSAASKMTVVPIEALVEGNGTEGAVFSPNDSGGVVRVPVKIAHIGGKEVGVSGLGDTKTVITDGVSFLNEKSKIKIVN